MKKVKVNIKNKNTLELLEDAKAGNIIALDELQSVDLSALEQAIQEQKDTLYNQKIQEARRQFENELKDKIGALERENNLKISNMEEKSKHDLDVLRAKHDEEIKDLELKNHKAHDDETNKLKDKINSLEAELKAKDEKEALKLENERIKIEQAKQDEIHQLEQKNLELANVYKTKLHEKEVEIDNLRREKARLNVKQIGEDLETWCNNQVLSYMQNGFKNCTWIKDNQVIRNEDEAKGSKADYIFKIYASDIKKDEELLTSICLDMKSENPDSVNKKKNSDYYDALNKNRLKKKCKIAVLVSELESENINDIPIFKVNEHEDMYVVRPNYLMTFLNMVVFLNDGFKQLILKDEAVRLENISQEEFKKEFDSLKNTYLDKPLDQLRGNIEAISKGAETIEKANKGIQEACDKITRQYLDAINNKLEKFVEGVNKQYKKL